MKADAKEEIKEKPANQRGVKVVDLDEKANALVGFTLKAGQTVTGFDPVLRAMAKKQILFILVSHDISPNTLKKIRYEVAEKRIHLFKTSSGTDWEARWGIEGRRILGFRNGELGRKLLKKFKVGE